MNNLCQFQFSYDLNFNSQEENHNFCKVLKNWLSYRDGDIGQIEELSSHQWLITCENEEKRENALHLLMTSFEPEGTIFHEGDLRKDSPNYFYYEIAMDNKKLFEGTYIFE